MNPTIAGFMLFITNVMGINATQLPANSPVIPFVYNLSMNTVNSSLTQVPNFDPSQPTIYAVAVYNLAADLLLNFAPNNPAASPPDSTYFTDNRAKMGLNSFVGGVISSTSDNSTSESLSTPDWTTGLTIDQLSNLNTPYGRVYLGIAMKYGALWGLT